MGFLEKVLPLPDRPGFYVQPDVRVTRTLILGNNALALQQVLRQLGKRGILANLLVVDTYGLEPDRASLTNLYQPQRISAALRQCPVDCVREAVLLLGPRLQPTQREAFTQAIARPVQVISSVADLEAESSPQTSPGAKNLPLHRPIMLEGKPLTLRQRLQVGLVNAVILILLETLFMAAFGLWDLWPLLPLTLGLGLVLPLLFEVVPFPWGVLRGILWGGLLAILWSGLAQFLWLIPPEVARPWAWVVLATAAWLGRGIYRPWHSLRWETAIALAVCVTAVAMSFLY